jgi:hypothetical protein
VPLGPKWLSATFEVQIAFSLVEVSFDPFGVMFVVFLIIMHVVWFLPGRAWPLGYAAAGFQSFLGTDYGSVVASEYSYFESTSFVDNCCYSRQLVIRNSLNINFDYYFEILNYPILSTIRFFFCNLVFEIQHLVCSH